MKGKFLILSLIVLAKTLALSQRQSFSGIPERYLPDMPEDFASINKVLTSNELTPENATSRIEELIQRIDHLKEKSMKSLYLINEYILYFRMKQNKVKDPRAMTDVERRNLRNFTGVSSPGISFGSSFDDFRPRSDTFNDPNEGDGVDGVRKLIENHNENNLAFGQPMIHEYGKISADDKNFEKISNPEENFQSFKDDDYLNEPKKESS